MSTIETIEAQQLGVKYYIIIIIIIIIITNRFYLTHPLHMVHGSNITFIQYSHTHT